MAVDIFLDPLTNDIQLFNGSMRVTQNIEESSRQQVLITLSAFKGEWLYDINFGIPYIENDNNSVKTLGVLNKSFLDSVIQNEVLARENIIKIITYTSTLDKTTGVLSVTLRAETNTGDVVSISTTVL